MKGVIEVIPVLPSANIKRDVKWYGNQLGCTFMGGDHMYSVLRLNKITLHLQWHADTDDDPLVGGSVIRISVEDIDSVFENLVGRGVVHKDKLRLNTDWGTHEFGLYDLNNNAIFFVQDV